MPNTRDVEPFEYPYEKVRVAAEVTPDAAHAVAGADTAAGAPERAPRIPGAFVEKEIAGAIDDRDVADALTQRIVYAHIERRSSNQAVLSNLLARARRAPTARNFERVRAVANEVGRRRGGGRLIRRTLTQDVASEMIDRGE